MVAIAFGYNLLVLQLGMRNSIKGFIIWFCMAFHVFFHFLVNRGKTCLIYKLAGILYDLVCKCFEEKENKSWLLGYQPEEKGFYYPYKLVGHMG